MYMPKFFEQKDIEKTVGLIKEYPLGTLVINSDNGFEVNHIPFVADFIETEQLRLRAHIPRSNAISKTIADGLECVVVFSGAEGYISPSWYASKKENGKVVPTWNYSVVHVHGNIVVRDDPDWVLQQLTTLTRQNESKRPESWAITDAPESFINNKISTLVGLELLASKIEAKTKASQNQPTVNQESVLTSLKSEQPNSTLRAMMESALGKNS